MTPRDQNQKSISIVKNLGFILLKIKILLFYWFTTHAKI